MTTIIYYKGYKILKTSNLFWVLGKCFKSLADAKECIDNL
jgi:hypothetical protein